MSKPPKVVIPGLNRGAGIHGGYIVGRHWRAKKGPAQLLDLHGVVAQGIETIAGSSQKNITTASTAHSETVSVSTSNSTSLSQISSSLSGAISTNTGQSTSLSQISSSLSGAISVNTGQSTSLSQISSSLSGAISSTTSLSTALSSSLSTVTSRLDAYVTVSTQAGTTYTAVLADANTYIQFTNGSPVTFTIPTNASVAFPTGTVIEMEQNGAGALTVAAAGGVTINSRGADLTLAGQYSIAMVKKVGTNTWTMTGDL